MIVYLLVTICAVGNQCSQYNAVTSYSQRFYTFQQCQFEAQRLELSSMNVRAVCVEGRY